MLVTISHVSHNPILGTPSKKIKNGYSEYVPITFATPTIGAYSEQKDGE